MSQMSQEAYKKLVEEQRRQLELIEAQRREQIRLLELERQIQEAMERQRQRKFQGG
jgi:hypothetical protein